MRASAWLVKVMVIMWASSVHAGNLVAFSAADGDDLIRVLSEPLATARYRGPEGALKQNPNLVQCRNAAAASMWS
jgi:hypothetical protein